jgi:hypothetical protein
VSKTKTTSTFTENKSKDKLLDVLCIKCSHLTKHRVVASLDENGSECDESEGWSADWINNYQVIQCQGCESVSFRHLHWFSEDAYPDFGEDGTTERLYPKRSANSIKAKALLNVPTTLRRIYAELIDCFNNECPTLCAAGLRALVEGICADRGIADGPISVPAKGGGTQVVRKGNLEGKIAGLEEKRILTQTSAQTLHQHRYLGNEAAHELARPSAEELGLAIEIIEHTLEHLYEIPERAEALRRTTAKRKK